jgi:hypothetical protein
MVSNLPSFIKQCVCLMSNWQSVYALDGPCANRSCGPAGTGKRSSSVCFSDLNSSLCAGAGTAWLDNTFDLVLSSGFLAFASHSGFLKAVSEAEINVGGVMGTSAGALSGSLFSAGYSPKQVNCSACSDPPISAEC